MHRQPAQRLCDEARACSSARIEDGWVPPSPLTTICDTRLCFETLAGIAFGLLSALFYGGYILVGSRVLRGLPPVASTATLLTSTAICFAFAALVLRQAPPPASTQVALVVAGIVLFSTVVPILTQMKGMPEIGSSRAAIIGTLEPLVTVILAMLVLHDRVTAWQLAGGALIVASIAVREGTELFPQSPVTT